MKANRLLGDQLQSRHLVPFLETACPQGPIASLRLVAVEQVQVLKPQEQREQEEGPGGPVPLVRVSRRRKNKYLNRMIH